MERVPYKCPSVLLSQHLLSILIVSQEIIQVLDYVEVHRPGREEGLSMRGLAGDPR